MELKRKNYNPCGELTGREIEICDAALTSYFNLPFAQVMRNIVVQEISRGAAVKNEQAILNWANYNLNDVENSAALDFQNFTPAQIGLSKYLLHLLFENRYNIEYNRLANYCATLDENILSAAESHGLTFDALERKINSIAQETNYAATFDDMTAELENFVRGFGG